MRAHLDRVPFENLDVQLGRVPPETVDAIFDKVVGRGRGGWCYEVNTLFGVLLADLGYTVTRLSGDVRRGGDVAERPGNHLCLRVDLDRPYLVDVGFGGSITAPLAIEPGTGVDGPYAIHLAHVDGDRWTFDETVGDGASFGFDFTTGPADEGILAAMRSALAREDWSPFVQNLVMQLRRGDTHWTLRGRVLTQLTPAGKTTRLLGSVDEMAAVGREIFGDGIAGGRATVAARRRSSRSAVRHRLVSHGASAERYPVHLCGGIRRIGAAMKRVPMQRKAIV